MTMRSVKQNSALAAVAFGLSYLMVPSLPGPAEAASGPFAGIDGRWSGNGVITISSGTKENLKCRVQYHVQKDGHIVSQTLRCASDSYKFESNAYVDHSNGQITGRWDELTYQVTGAISGKFASGKIEATVVGTGFTAGFDVLLRGDRQTVNIRPTNAEVTDVKIDLRRIGR